MEESEGKKMGALGWIVTIGIIAAGLYLWKRYRDVQEHDRQSFLRIERSNGGEAVAVATAFANRLMPDEAKAALRRGAELGNAEAANELGGVLVQEKDYDGAISMLRRASALGKGEASTMLGYLLFREKGDKAGAIAAFEDGIAKGTKMAATQLSQLLEEQGDVDGAIATLEKGISNNDREAAFSLGLLMEKRNDEPGAIAAYERAIELKDGRSASNLGSLLKDNGDLPGAVAAYQRGVELRDPAAAFNLGILFEQQGDLPGAIEAVDKAVKWGFRHPDTQLRNGRAYLDQLRQDLAREQTKARMAESTAL